MSSCYLSTCPQSHRRPRDAMRENWSDLVSEWTPVWAVHVDDRPAVVALAPTELVVTGAAPEHRAHTIGFDQVADVSAVRSVVHIMDRGGNCFDFTFSDGGDAVRAAKVIEEMRAAACERWAEEAVVGPGPEPEDLLARRSNGHPAIGGRKVRWVDDADLDTDLAEDLDEHVQPEAAVEAAVGADPEPVDATVPLPVDDAQVTPAVDARAEDEEPDAGPADQPAPEPAPPAPATELEINDYPRSDGADWGQLPIEREVAMALAAGLPLDRPAAPPAQEPRQAAPEPVVTIPAQAAAPPAESVLLVTTDVVPGRGVALVHGDVLAVVSWPSAGQPGRGVHEAARDQLAQAALRRGGDAVIGLRYGSTGAIGGDIVAYGTAVTLEPVEAPEPEQPAVAVTADSGAAGEG